MVKKLYFNVLLIFFIIFLTLMLLLKLNAQLKIKETFGETKEVHHSIDKPVNILNEVRRITQCSDRPRSQTVALIGNYTVLHNVALADEEFQCHESITYSSQGDYSYLDNIVPIVRRWNGPVSVALHAPGDDFQPTLDSIAYVRSCETELIRRLVSFHVYYERAHPPKLESDIVHYLESYNWAWNCSVRPAYETSNHSDMYRIRNKMPFYINVGRNIATSQVQTHFLLSADLELYPSLNVVPNFFDMLVRDYKMLESFPKRVYVLATFESSGDYQSPQTKSELQHLFELGEALFFVQKYCPECHNIPNKPEWLAAEDNGKLAVFSNTSRMGAFRRWEPVYIATHAEPMFLERITWEGGSDKMVKDFVLCLQDYKLLLLDNAFIVHKPGFKSPSPQLARNKKEMTKIILDVIVPELEAVYGTRKGCVIGGQFSKNLPIYD